MKLSTYTQLFLFLLLMPMCLTAQKKVVGYPDKFISPLDLFDETSRYESSLRETGTKSKDNGWMVISDRDENPVYDKANGSQIGVVNFRDYFFVTDEKDEWVEIVEASVDRLKIVNLKRAVGWMPKKNLLLWNTGLVGQNTHIHKKVLLLNRADDINNVLKYPDRSLVDIFRGPNTSEKEPTRKIFDFYFIMKKDMETGMYLLSQEAIISPFTMEKIIGWVSSRRCDPWDTRICLEPNFDELAFSERKGHDGKYKLRAFKTEGGARKFAENGDLDKKEVFWEDDPVVLSRDKMASENPRRFKGSVVRFPMISVSKSGNSSFEYYQSGVIGSIKVRKDGSPVFTSEIAETKYGKFQDYKTKLEMQAQKVNVFLVAEGTDSVFAYRQQLVQALNNINSQVLNNVPKVNYGALVYRDLPEEAVTIDGQTVNRLTEHISLTPNLGDVTKFLEKVEFQSKVDRDDYTAQYYALSKTLSIAGFNPDELNIILLVGCYGDFRFERDRKTAAEGHPALFEDNSTIIENLNKLNAHLYALQLRNDGTRAARTFAKASQVFILENAKFAFNRLYGNQRDPEVKELLAKLKTDYGIEVKEPTMAEPSELDNIALVNSRIPGRLIMPPYGKNLDPSQVSTILSNDVQESLGFVKNLKSIVSKIYDKGDSPDLNEIEAELNVDAGRYTSALADYLNKILEDKQLDKDDVLNSLDEKYKLYTEVTIPYRLVGATYPSVSHVLFMPESDLVVYQSTIQRAIAGATGSYDKKREALFEVYKELVSQFTGEGGVLRNKKPDELTRKELVELMQGVYEQGLPIEMDNNIKLKDLLDEKKVSNEQVDELMLRFTQIEKRLSTILRAADTYEFCYSTDDKNRYYWIPLAEVF
ncbi:MAG: hypothetical protein H6577_13845 [Lewinellaceae bacterium]|nr:hypothetical protein [Lewinellaceae bacterium]